MYISSLRFMYLTQLYEACNQLRMRFTTYTDGFGFCIQYRKSGTNKLIGLEHLWRRLFCYHTQQRSRLEGDTSGVNVLDQLTEDIRLELLDDEGGVLLTSWL